MKKTLTLKEATYISVKNIEIAPEETTVENVEKLVEHLDNYINESKIEILINEKKLTENVNEMKAIVNKDAFKALFGPKTKPKKGDVMSITGLAKKFNVKKSKKFKAGKKGKGYKLTLKAA